MLLTLALSSLALAAEPTHLTVDAALARLEDHNPTLARARAQVQSAKGGALVALSGTLPSLTLSGGYTRNNEEVELDMSELFDVLGDLAEMTGNDRPESPEPFLLQPLQSASGTATIRVPLITPSTWAQTSAARRGVDAAEASYDATLTATRASATQAFWSAGAAEAYASAQEASVERARRLVATAEVAARVGTSTPLALLQAQTDLARREGDALQARATVEKARVAVGVALGEPGPIAVDLPEAHASDIPDPDTAVKAAWDTRPEIRAANEQVAAARAQLLAVRLGAAPNVSGSFSVFASTEPYMTGDYTGWRGTVDLTWPIIQGGLRAGNETKAQAALADAQAALDNAELQVSQQVRVAVADLQVAGARLEVAGRQRTLAEQGANIAQRSFDEGLVDSAAVLDALDRLDAAKAAEIDARARLGTAEANLRAATGRW